MPGRLVLTALIGVGSPNLTVGSSVLGLESQTIKRERELACNIHLSLLPDCTYNVSRRLVLLLPQLPL